MEICLRSQFLRPAERRSRRIADHARPGRRSHRQRFLRCRLVADGVPNHVQRGKSSLDGFYQLPAQRAVGREHPSFQRDPWYRCHADVGQSGRSAGLRHHARGIGTRHPAGGRRQPAHHHFDGVRLI